MQEESFRANNPFWCIVFDVMSLGLDESTRPLIQQFPYQPYLQAERYNLSEVYEWYYSTNAILADDNQATAYDHLGLNALCYALQFLLRNAAGTRLVDIREDGTAVFIGSMLFNFLINRGIRFNRSVTRDGLSFVQYAERFLNHPEFPLHIEDYNFFLRTYNPPLEIPAPQLIVEEPAPQVDDAQVEEPAPQVDELQPALELIVPALHEPAININEGMHPRFFQNNTTRLSLLVLILSLVAGIGYTSM